MDIPTKEIKLPFSGFTAHIKEYLSFDEALEATGFEGNTPDMIRYMFKAAVIKVVDKETKEVDTKEFLKSCHLKDGLAMQEHINTLLDDLKDMGQEKK